MPANTASCSASSRCGASLFPGLRLGLSTGLCASLVAGLLLGGSASAQSYTNTTSYCSGVLGAAYTGEVRSSGNEWHVVISLVLANNASTSTSYQLTQPAASSITAPMGAPLISGTLAAKLASSTMTLARVSGLRHPTDGPSALGIFVRQVKIACS